MEMIFEGQISAKALMESKQRKIKTLTNLVIYKFPNSFYPVTKIRKIHSKRIKHIHSKNMHVSFRKDVHVFPKGRTCF